MSRPSPDDRIDRKPLSEASSLVWQLCLGSTCEKIVLTVRCGPRVSVLDRLDVLSDGKSDVHKEEDSLEEAAVAPSRVSKKIYSIERV
jgi:hypothetical protein